MTRGFTRIAPSAVGRRYTRVPILDDGTVAFCRMINSNPPSIIPIAADPAAAAGRCFWNVGSKVERDAGEAVFGWAVFEFPRAYHEAQHHAVWRSPSGGLVDVTPPVYRGLDTGLFVKDASAEVDLDAPRIQPLRRSGAPMDEVQAFMAFHARIQRAVFLLRDGEAPEDDPGIAALRRGENDAKTAMLLAIANGLDDDDPCVCGAATTFRDCCAPHFT